MPGATGTVGAGSERLLPPKERWSWIGRKVASRKEGGKKSTIRRLGNQPRKGRRLSLCCILPDVHSGLPRRRVCLAGCGV